MTPLEILAIFVMPGLAIAMAAVGYLIVRMMSRRDAARQTTPVHAASRRPLRLAEYNLRFGDDFEQIAEDFREMATTDFRVRQERRKLEAEQRKLEAEVARQELLLLSIYSMLGFGSRLRKFVDKAARAAAKPFIG